MADISTRAHVFSELDKETNAKSITYLEIHSLANNAAVNNFRSNGKSLSNIF
jgi:hypothetical protein